MNEAKINKLIARRERLTNRRDGLTDWSIIDGIDVQLAKLSAPGDDNRVDQLLGRLCATPSQTPRIVMVAVDTADKCETKYDEAWFEQVIDKRNAEARDEATSGPMTASLPQLTGTATVANDWRTFITRCNDTPTGSQWADRGEDHE